MSTYQVRVEDKIGTTGDTTALSDWLLAGAKYITNLLPPERLEKFTATLTDSGSGVSVTTYRVLSAHKSSYGARRVPHTLAAQVAATGSIHYAGSTDPVYYILNGTAYVKPGGGSVIAMAYPTVAYTDSAITGFPADLDEGVVLYAAIQGRIRQLSDLAMTTVNGLSFADVVPPTAPDAPSFSYTDAVYSDASYSPASFVKALIDTVSATTISFSDTLTYNPPAFAGSYTNADTALTNQDIDLANAHLNKVNVQLEEMQKDLLVSLNEFNKDKGEFDAALQVAISQAQLTQQRLIEQSKEQIALNKFNEQLELQTALANQDKQAQIDAQNKAKAMELSIINESKELERQIQEYQADLQKYGQEMNEYSAKVQQEVSKVSTQLNQYGQQSQIMLTGLQALRNEFNEFLKSI